MKSLFVFAAVLSAFSLFADVQKASVTASVLNVRVKPSSKSDALIQLKRGDEVVVLEKGAEWTAIRPPEKSSLYVSSPLIADGKLKTNGNLRAGSGVNFQSLGILPAGTPVTVLEDKNSWSRIAVPAVDIRCYVATAYLKFAEPVKTPSVPAAVSAPEKKVEVTKDDVISFREADLEALKDIYVKGTERNVDTIGVLRETTSKKYGKTYILRANDGRHYHVAGVIPVKKIDCSKEVRVRGVSYVLYKWKFPLLLLKNVSQK